MLVVFASCGFTRQNESNENPENNSIAFVVLSIRKEKADAKSVIELVSKTQSPGTIKKQAQHTPLTGNYLSIYLYKNKKLSDSMIVEHPLHKHFEYSDANGALAVKDTIFEKADFSIRLQIQGQSNEIRIFETLRNKTRREELATLKL